MSPKKSRPDAGPTSASSIPKVATGVRGLDEILDGGFPAGRTTMLSGGPGTGKTVLAMEFLVRGAEAGEPGVFVSFEERADDLRANVRAMGLGVPALEKQNRLRIVHAPVPHEAVRAGEFDLKGLLAILEGHTRAIGARRLVIDAIDVLMRLFRDADREREELYQLNDWLRDRGLTAVLTAKTSEEGALRYPFLDFMVDCVLYLDQRIVGQVRTRRLGVVKYRGSGFLSNEYPYVITGRGVVLMPVSSMGLIQESTGEAVPAGVPAIDEALGGGLRQGSSVLITGPSGVGKTSLACTFARAACERGERALFISFEESEASLLAGMRSVGIDLKPAVDAGTLRVVTGLPESGGAEEHLLAILTAMEEADPRHVVVDAISACRRMGSERAAFDLLVRLLTACRRHRTTCVFINQMDEPSLAADISGLGISSLIDTLILLRYHDHGHEVERQLLVVKSRGMRHSMRYHRLRITGEGLQLDAEGRP